MDNVQATLERLDRLVADGERRIVEQEVRISRLRILGLPTGHAEYILATMWDLHAHQVALRNDAERLATH